MQNTSFKRSHASAKPTPTNLKAAEDAGISAVGINERPVQIKAEQRVVKTPPENGSGRLVRPPKPWKGDEPPFVLARNGGFYGMERVRPSDLVHVNTTGSTSSGKTTSVVLPLMKAGIEYKLPHPAGPSTHCSMLIVDPKQDLYGEVKLAVRKAGRTGDLVMLGQGSGNPPLAFFEVDDGLSMRDRMGRLNAVMQTSKLAEGNIAYWQTEGQELLIGLLQLEEAFRAKSQGRSLVELLLGDTCGVFWKDLSQLFALSRLGPRRLTGIANTLAMLLETAELAHLPQASLLQQFISSPEDYTQWQYRVQAINPMVNLLSDPNLARVVDLDPFPDADRQTLNARDMLDAGLILLFQPQPTPSDDLAARAIKAKVFEAVRSRIDMLRPVMIVIDEFQRFITDDPVSGDANFLDTARAYRTNCVLATQSVGALLLALGNDARAKAAVDAILANTPSKWFFASKDTATREAVRALIPSLPAKSHITDVRTLAQLKPGHAYWSMADGSWGLGCAELDKLL